ncbi:MAG: xanthine dehydrogenase family protein molybdopterin-binding subunit [Candidatus Asgardarchaeia archaeon]
MAITEQMMKSEDLMVVGKPIKRIDAYDKVTGLAKYVRDLKIEHMLYAYAFRSSRPHAKIKSLDVSEARKVPGVAAVVTADDVPGENIVPIILNDRPLLAKDKVRYIGEAIVLIAAETKEIAKIAAGKIKIEYEDLPAVLDPREAMKEDAPWIHDFGNVFTHYKIRTGDVEKAFKEADLIIENEYQTNYQEHLYLEPQGALAIPEGNAITIYSSTQCPFYVQKAVAKVLGIPRSKVRVVVTTVGGGFGGKEDVPSWVAAEAAVLAWITKKPVLMEYDREEDLETTSKRHPGYIRYKSAFKKDGTLIGIKVEYIIDAGAYSTLSPAVIFRGTVHALGPYKIPNVWIDGYAVATNKVPTGAYRGFGSPQVIFAYEQQIDEAAYKLGLDPAEIRLKNGWELGDKTPTGQILRYSVGLKDTIRKAIEVSKWYEKRKEYSKDKGTRRRGIGMSTIFYGVGLGAAGKILERSGATVQVTPDGSVIVVVGTSEMGQGMRTALAQIAAEALGVTIDRVYLPEADTMVVPDSGPTVASRATLMSGNAIINAAEEIKKNLLKVASEEMGVPVERLDIKNNKIFDKENTNVFMEFSKAADKAYAKGVKLAAVGWYHGPDTTFDEEGHGNPYFVYSYATHVAEVEVDMETGKINVIDYYAVHDSGKIVNPIMAEGQVQGGVAQGIGYALTEDLIVKDGKILNPNLTDYLIPSIKDVPEIKVYFVEATYPEGPFGAKGLGEPCLMPVAAAIANAVRHATGVRITKIPMTPEKVYFALKKKVH